MSRLKDLSKIEQFVRLTDEIIQRQEKVDLEPKKFIHGISGKVEVREQLFYVLGALLGDGCAFHYPINNYQVQIVGSREFAEKFSSRIHLCTDKTTRIGKDTKQDCWYAKTNNFELYALFSRSRADLDFLSKLITEHGRSAAVLFIEGFFDAEGCVKIIKEPVRKTPKICPDICNTNFEFLELVRKLLQEHLGIIARYSNQEAYLSSDGFPRKKSYHLRIYKKEFVRVFFENIHTIKLSKEKIEYVNSWLELNTAAVSPLRSFPRPSTS